MTNGDLNILRGLRQEQVQRLFAKPIFRRGERYYEERRVRRARRYGATLQAEVQGTEACWVRVRAEDGMLFVSCTCPFAEEEPCKHVAAVLLQWLREPRSFVETPDGDVRFAPMAVPETSAEFALDLDDVAPSSPPLLLHAMPPWWSAPDSATEAGAEPGRSLQPLLKRLTLNDLRETARQRGWRFKGLGKDDYARVLARLLTDPTEIARAATSLPDALRTALRAALVAEDGRGISPAGLASAFTAIEVFSGRALKPVEAAALLQDLARWGLVIPWRDGPDRLQRYLFPWEIQRHVPPLPGWCPQAKEPPASSVSSMDGFVEVLHRVWHGIAKLEPRQRPAPGPAPDMRLPSFLDGWPCDVDQMSKSAKGQPRSGVHSAPLCLPPPAFMLDEESFAALRPVTEGDAERLEFTCRLLLQLDALRLQGDHLVPQREVMTNFLCRPAREQRAILIDAYLSTSQWSELDVVLRANPRLTVRRHLFAGARYDQYRSSLVRLRLRLLRFLASAGEEGWCSIVDAETALCALWKRFFDAEETSDSLWQSDVWWAAWRDSEEPLSTDDPQTWRALQGRFLQAALEGPLFWLGLVDLFRDDGQLRGFRIHGLADYVWGRPLPSKETPPTGDAVALDEANMTISVRPDVVSPQAHPLLASMARLEEAAPSRFVYRLDMEVSHASFEQGRTLRDLQAGWEESVPAQMPLWVHAELSRWWSAYGQVRLYDGFALLELGDDVALRELQASTSLLQLPAVTLTPRLVLVPDEAVDGLIRELKSKGYTPREVR